MAMINIDKFVASLIKYYCEAYGIDRASIRCWFDDALEEQGLEYKNGEIVKTQRRVAAEAKEAIFDNEDERIRKRLLTDFSILGKEEWGGLKVKDICAWLEKQKDIDSKEYVFRPLAGCHINTAAIQAVEQQKLGNKVVLAFNGAYIPVKEKTADDIVNEYYSWLEKQKPATHIYNEGDWLVSKYGGIFQVKKVLKGSYILLSESGAEEINSIIQVDDASRLLTMHDIVKKKEEQKPAWSEEDEKILYDILYFLNSDRITDNDREDAIQWLKSLKDRLKGE